MLLGKLATISKILNENKPCSFHSASFMALSLSLTFTVIGLCGFYVRENDSNVTFIFIDSPYEGGKGKLEIL